MDTAHTPAPSPTLHNYMAFWRGKKMEVQAPTSYAAQQKAAKLFKARKEHEVAVVLIDQPVSTVIG